jgi:hypothetical protein
MLGAVGASVVVAAGSACQRGGQSAKPGTYKLAREIPVTEGYDLVVAGGGPAGAAAAITAARLGAKVLLVESTGCMGGMGTSGLVTAFGPLADGEKMLIRGLMEEIIETLYKRGFMPPSNNPDMWRRTLHLWTPFHPEGYKLVLDEMATKAGVDICFFTRVIDADADAQTGRVHGVILSNIEGYRYVRAKAFVDGTGDATLADLCGVVCRAAGHDSPHIMPPTLCSLVSGIDFSRFKGQQKAVEQAIKDRFLTQPDLHLPGLFRTGNGTASMNAGHLFNLDALRCKNLTDGVMLGRRLAQEFVAFYRKYVPGCENMEHICTAQVIGIRESRRILGEYEMTERDYLARRQFPDQIAVYGLTLDLHPYEASVEQYQRWQHDFHGAQYKPGEYYGIPYGALVPKGWKNLWVAGRSISTDVKVQSSTRAQPAAIAMGQAAGAAAVQSISTQRPAPEIDTEVLVTTLRKAGAYLPQTQTSKTMTRAA